MSHVHKGFPVVALEYIRCLACEGTLSFEASVNQSEVLDGKVECVACSKTYNIRGGILLMDGNIADERMRSEIVARDEGAQLYDKRLDKRYYKEIEPTLRFIGPTRQKTILELGCGTGRFTKFFGDASIVIAVDFSRESLRVLSQKHIDTPVACVCADVTSFLCKKDSVDLVVSAQVIEHIPRVLHREKLYTHIQNFLKPDGMLVLSAYHFGLRRRIKRESKTGCHTGGIFYTYFTKADIVREVGERLSIRDITYIDITLPLEIRLGINERIGGYISRIVSYIPLVRLLAHIVLMKAYKHEEV